MKALESSFSSIPKWNLPFKNGMNVSDAHQTGYEENKHGGMYLFWNLKAYEHNIGKHCSKTTEQYLLGHCILVSSLTTKSLSTGMLSDTYNIYISGNYSQIRSLTLLVKS